MSRKPASPGGKLSVARDIGYVSFGKYGQYLVTLVTLPVSARLLGPSGMGLLAIAMSTYFLGSLVADLGIAPYLAARVQEPGLARLRGDYAGLRLAVLAVLALGYASVILSGAGSHVQMAALGLLGGAASAAGDDWVLLGTNRFGTIMLLQSAGRVLYLAALLAALPVFPTPEVAMACLVLSTLVPVAGSWAVTIRDHGLPARPANPAPLVRTGGPVLVARLLENTYEQGAATMFSPALTARSLGLFSGSDRPVQAVGSLLDAVGWSLIPRMARRRGDADDFWSASLRGARAVALVAVLAAASGWLLAPWATSLVFGREFAESAQLLRVEVWALPGMAVASFFSTAVLPVRGDSRGVVTGSALGAAVALAALAVALRTRSPMAVVAGVVAAESAVALFYMGRVRSLRRRGSGDDEAPQDGEAQERLLPAAEAGPGSGAAR